jgi:ArsR family transcriptional regulator
MPLRPPGLDQPTSPPTSPPSGPPVNHPVNEVKAALFKALGHPGRVRLLELLVDGERPVSALVADLGLEPSHVSQHLALLRQAGVVTSRREGNAVYYRLASHHVAELLAVARAFVVEALTGNAAVLDALVADDT